MTRVCASFFLAVVLCASVGAQERTAPQIVEEWFIRWNALDGTQEAVNRLLELYGPDALLMTGPSQRQIGTAVYEGRDAIRKMADDFVKAHSQIAFHIEYTTANGASKQLFHAADGPWGGIGIAVEYVGAYTVRESSKRYMYPGAAFFQIQNGKIRRLRLYIAAAEMAEVSR